MDRCAALGCSNEVVDHGGEFFFPVPTDLKLKNAWETNLGRSDLSQSSVICEKHFTSQDVVCDESGQKTLKPDTVPSMFGAKTIEEGKSPVRRSNRKRVAKKRVSESKSSKKTGRAARPLFKTVAKSPEKRPRPSKNEDENSDPNQHVSVKPSPGRPRKNKERCETTVETQGKKIELIGDDERGHAIAEWYLIDVFEATRIISSALQKGAQVTDDLVANMEDTIIEIISMLLQRLSSVLITSLEQELGVKCNIMTILKNLHENIKENVKQLAVEDDDNSTTRCEPEENSYEEALNRLDLKNPAPFITEEVISPPFDEDCMLIEHNYSRSIEEEIEQNAEKEKGGPKKITQKLQCGFCTFKTYWKSKLRLHIKNHLQRKSLDCPMCDYTASSNEAYNKHMRTHTGEKPFACSICNFRTANKSNLNRHLVIHSGLKPFACPYCEHTTRQKGSLDSHIATHTMSPRERGKGKKNVYICGDCSFITISRSEFNIHAKIHKKFSCGHCDFVGNDYQELRVHQVMHNGERHCCPHCKRKCKSADELRLHLETHNEEGEELVCDMCNYRTFRSAYFKRHVACHSGDKPFKCEVCLSTFRLQAHLTMHTRKHEIGPYCKRSSM